MMDAGPMSDMDLVRDLAVAYCEAIHHARPDVFVDMCHDRFMMTEVTAGGTVNFWDKDGYLARVAGRQPFPGAPSYGILSVDVAGGETARVHLWVDVPPRRYEDHLGFVRVAGAWRLMTKVFRTMGGPVTEN
ncbi:MAG: hypothetical protein EP307_02855 [Rhodobacteraceae bacterium]|nr:MAG: hypothetical protein EP307_02855 [Paracoccaceae bacterium]